ncbi:hypothetical protein KOR34_44120 [Posidoniimonas corsicana]|uniref:Ice-binding protein C-terminal domain-containing protein n=1 Tax=Posidoniimonas corsicana TaxID=1938618 RepID=A0A5C5UXZ9_9BACT|nr:PEP-CTERM sorting domain-containing protein [Posidoniimonas corsicana]TWT31038.1 hypothetical protein KOR34_44120 [Posidoniimonas corsicana]
MSLKNILCVAAMAALTASPVLAQPIVTATNTGLDANGDWVWEVNVVTDAEGSVATELDATFSDADLLAGVIGNTTVFDFENPSGTTLGWVTRDGDGVVGFQASPANNEATAALGSDDVAAGTYLLGTFTTAGPSTTGSLTTSVGVSGIIAQLGTNNSVSASESRTAYGGDANLDGNVNFDDVLIVSPNFGGAVTNGWAGADFTGDGLVNFDDILVLSPNFGTSAPAATAGGASAPEPASLALAGLLACSAAVRRRR